MIPMTINFPRPVSYISDGQFISSGSWIHPRRVIDSYELILVTQGEVAIAEEESSYSVQAGEVLLLLPGCEHYGTMQTENVSFYWLHFFEEGFTKRLSRQHFHNLNSDPLLVLTKQLLHYAGSDRYPEQCANYLMTLLLIELLLPGDAEQDGKLVSELKEYIRLHSDHPLSLQELSAHFGYHRDYLTRVFKGKTGMSLKHYMDTMSMEKAKQMLLSGKYTLQKLAAALGYEDYNLFLKKFTYHEHMSPSHFRATYYRTHLNNK